MTGDNSLSRFVWFDLMTSDAVAAVTFYTRVVGWGTQQWKSSVEGASPYTMWTAEGNPIGGVMPMPPGVQAPPHWLGYVGTADVDGAVRQATSLGATVHVPPTPIPEVGTFAVLADPQGASFAVYASPQATPPAPGRPRVGEFSWAELATTDHGAALDFYGALFGWEGMEPYDMGPLGIYQIYGRGGVPMGGMYTIVPAQPMPPNWCHYVRVSDIETAAGRCVANGAALIHGPADVPGGDRIVMATDPQGAMFALHEVRH